MSRTTRRIGSAIALFGGVSGISMISCVSPDSPLIEDSSKGCEELDTSTDPTFADLDVDDNVRSVMAAAVDFSKAAERTKTDVLAACAGIARDLGAEDTWSGIEKIGEAITNSDGTGACDRANAEIEALVPPGQTVSANIAIAVTRGECHLDFQRQVDCDQRCSTKESCDPGTVETRCDPAHLSVMCSAECKAGAFCVGTPDLPANCMGQCESECVGECHGTCLDSTQGELTEGSPNCNGKCSSSCQGKCRGLCKIQDASSVACGSGVRCTGGCTGSYTAPQCTTEFTPPDCDVDTVCHDICTARVVANPVCTPTSVFVYVTTDSPELQPLVPVLQAHLPRLFDAAERDGRLAVDAGKRLFDSASKLDGQIENLSGKSLACLGASTTKVSASLSDLNIAVDQSTNLTVMLEDRSL